MKPNTKPEPKAKTVKPNTKKAATKAATKAKNIKRVKANYDIVKGDLLNYIKKHPGVTLNGLNDQFGVTKDRPNGLKFPVIYHGIQLLKKASVVFGTGAKKNEGLYLTKKEAQDNKPEPVIRTPRKKDSPYVLEKLTSKGGWRAVEGNTEKEPILKAYETASSVPGTTFQVIDNTGKEPKVIKTNKVEKAKEPKPTKTTKEPKPVKVA